ncbi:Glucokinase [Caulifigura coniformis]|uniref:Glucokinase n=1 Tax=Caulifigura coniformis TaxID=2527983 RepID=A0A517SFQ0_9PLAN|nr:ROK family protein [Caulifigura coniformis]QDT54949.1 Glucokinase [Caulifigura coniformis]
MDDVFAGVDVGGTSVKLAFGTADGEILAESSIPTESHRGPDSVLKRIAEGVKHLTAQTGAAPRRIGMGIPGIVDIPRGITKFLPNLMGHWKDVPAADTLSALVDCPVTLLNDVRTATLGELAYGHGRNPAIGTFVLMAIGTGIGGGVVIDRKLRLGPIGAAGEVGHQTIQPDGPRCGCGNYGCLETLASGTAIAAEGVRLVLMGLAPILREKSEGNTAKITAKLVAESADEGDDACRDAIQGAGRWLGIAVANIVTTIHPDLIVIGGGVSRIGEVLIERIREEVVARVPMYPPETIRVEPSLLSDKAGILGAVALAARGLA